MLDLILLILRNLYSNVYIDPAIQCTLYHPSVGKYFKTFDIIAALYYFQKPTTNYFDPINQLTGISSISPNKLQSRKCPLNLFWNKLRGHFLDCSLFGLMLLIPVNWLIGSK